MDDAPPLYDSSKTTCVHLMGDDENNVFDHKVIDEIIREQPLIKLYTPDFNRVWVVPDLGDPIIVSNLWPHAIWTQSHFRWDKIQDPAFLNVLC